MNEDANSLQQIRGVCGSPSFYKCNYMICIIRIPKGQQLWCAMGLDTFSVGRRITAASTQLFFIFSIQVLKEKTSMSSIYLQDNQRSLGQTDACERARVKAHLRSSKASPFKIKVISPCTQGLLNIATAFKDCRVKPLKSCSSRYMLEIQPWSKIGKVECKDDNASVPPVLQGILPGITFMWDSEALVHPP